MGDVAVACRYLPVFELCGAVPVMKFGENIASLLCMKVPTYQFRAYIRQEMSPPGNKLQSIKKVERDGY